MKKRLSLIAFCSALSLILFFHSQCNGPSEKEVSQDALVYLNHHDSVKYVGMETCRSCHGAIYNTFIETGMGQSFHPASKKKSAADFSKAHLLYDRFTDFYYRAYWQSDDMMIMEFRLQGKDTVHKRIEKVAYIIGSGQHTNSHIMSVNGYLYQMPLTWYAQQKKWDLPPGFENGRNSRFSRIIGEECMSCHNALPGFVAKSENKFTTVPEGIDCERCHGPGELHAKEKLAGIRVDTTGSNFDPTIVNPRHLKWERQIDLCQRCHLQGNSVLKEGKSFRDFRPGMKLSDFWEVYMPRYSGADKEFIMASHAERLQMSSCFVGSNRNREGAGLQMTCINCHNPHVSVKVTGKQVFNNACMKCHPGPGNECSMDEPKREQTNQNNCVNCHMPRSGTVDIPHVTVHDHYIRKPLNQEKETQLKQYLGIASVNPGAPDVLNRIHAFISYYERYEGPLQSLDSAASLLRSAKMDEKMLQAAIHISYLRNRPAEVFRLLQDHASIPIHDAWTCYRIGQSHMNMDQNAEAEKWFTRALKMAPHNLDFRNKLAEACIKNNKLNEARELLQQLLYEQPRYVSALNNMGFASLLMGDGAAANGWYEKALKLDPDYEPALLNKAGLYNSLGQKDKARDIILRLLKKKPGDARLKQILSGI